MISASHRFLLRTILIVIKNNVEVVAIWTECGSRTVSNFLKL